MSYFQSIKLENYRNFKNFETDFISRSNVLIGKNGSGKTNILESISLFETGRGFRKDNLKNFVNHDSENNHFKVTSVFINNNSNIDLSISNQIKDTSSIKKIIIAF